MRKALKDALHAVETLEGDLNGLYLAEAANGRWSEQAWKEISFARGHVYTLRVFLDPRAGVRGLLQEADTMKRAMAKLLACLHAANDAFGENAPPEWVLTFDMACDLPMLLGKAEATAKGLR